MIDSNSKILIICPIGLGNFLMCTPALKEVENQINHKIDGILALKPGIQQMAEASGLFKNIHSWNPDDEGPLKGLSLIRKIRKEKYTHQVLLFPTGHWKFQLFAKLCGGKQVGFDYGDFWSKSQKEINTSIHDVEQNLSLLNLSKEFKSEEVQNPWKHTLSNESSNYFVCHPGCSQERMMDNKRLPEEKFKQLIRHLNQEHNLKCLLVGGPEEKELRATIQLGMEECFLDTPMKSLEECSFQMSQAKFFLGNDSGLMHIASSIKLPSIAFFGPTGADRTGPWYSNPNNSLVIRDDKLECAPCWTLENLGNNQPCKYGDYRCLTQLELPSYFKTIDKWILEL